MVFQELSEAFAQERRKGFFYFILMVPKLLAEHDEDESDEPQQGYERCDHPTL